MLVASKLRRDLFFLILISALVRAFLAAWIDLNNDEVYYWTYALFPDLSHFDHPPMVGWMIQLFTLDLRFESEFFIRLGAVVTGTLNTWMIYMIGKHLKDELTGFYAAVLYTSSVYCFVISGLFIHPDTPQVTFWLLSLYIFLKVLSDRQMNSRKRQLLLLAGVTTGLAMLSKYTSVFLWFGALLMIITTTRQWLRTKELYISILLSILIFSPVIIWNYRNDFVSFLFQGERMGAGHIGLTPKFFGTELLGQFFYNNPVNVILIFSAIAAFIRRGNFVSLEAGRALLYFGLPVIVTFILFSLFRKTLPHWSGPGYVSLTLLAALWLRSRKEGRGEIHLFPRPLVLSLGFLIATLVLGAGQIKGGWVNMSRLGIRDISVELVGWEQVRDGFAAILKKDQEESRISPEAVIISRKWFPAAHLDYYVAQPLHKKLLAIQTLNEIHKYAWINKERGGLKPGMDAYYITSSLHFRSAGEFYSWFFERIDPPDTIPIMRHGKIANQFFVYRMMNLKEIPDFGLPEQLKSSFPDSPTR